MGYSARRRWYASAAAIFATLMLAVLALIARSGMTGATDRVIFGIQLLLWGMVLTAFPFVLKALLGGAHKRPRRADRVPKMTSRSAPHG